MKNIIKIWLLLKIHKSGLCKPFHWKKEGSGSDFDGELTHFEKGYCRVLHLAFYLTNKEGKND